MLLQWPPRCLGNGVARDIVHRGAKPTRDNNHIAACNARLDHSSNARQVIADATEKALRDLFSAKLWLPAAPVTFTIEFKDAGLADNAARMPYTKMVDPRTVCFTADDYLTAFMGLRSMIALSRG